MPPDDDFAPATQAELAQFLADNFHGPKRRVTPAGGRTALAYGLVAPADARSSTGGTTTLATNRLTGVVDYPARDMTVTVEAGIRMGDLAALLRGERQQLPIDVPQADRATLGGVLACDVSGSRRYGYGTLRDYVLGLTAVDGQGRSFHSGGRVVKNVAGYDLCKLMVGSVGTLGVISQVTLKLKPIPETTGLLWATFDLLAEIDDALTRLLKSDARPVSLDVLSDDAARTVAAGCRRPLPVDRPTLLIGVEGSAKDVAWQLDALTRELAPLGPDEVVPLGGDDALAIRAALTEFPAAPPSAVTTPGGSNATLSFRASLPPSAAIEFAERAVNAAAGIPLLVHAANGVVHGHLPNSVATIERASEILATLRAFARERRGHVVLAGVPEAWAGRVSFHGDDPPGLALMRGLKAAFDPANLLNPGRLL